MELAVGAYMLRISAKHFTVPSSRIQLPCRRSMGFNFRVIVLALVCLSRLCVRTVTRFVA